ncbi:MAG: hypothetical protein QW292_12710 [Candidatus Parvarchaeota archaeon]
MSIVENTTLMKNDLMIPLNAELPKKCIELLIAMNIYNFPEERRVADNVIL